MILTIISPDKLTLSMFSDFYKSLYNPEIKIIDLNYMYSEDILANIINDLDSKTSKDRYDILIKCLSKKWKKDILPALLEKSSTLITFELYATEPQLIKESNDFSRVINRWKLNIERLNKIKV